MIHTAFTCSLSLSPPPTSYNRPALQQPCYNLVQMFLCRLFNLYLVSSVCTGSHSRGRQYNGACHLVHPLALLLFDVTVRAVLWPWTQMSLLYSYQDGGLVYHTIGKVWEGLAHSNYHIISSYGLFIWISYLNRYGSGHRSLNKKRYF